MSELRQKLLRLFCQHCQALQKEMGWQGEPCWVLGMPKDPDAICASANDVIDAFLEIMSGSQNNQFEKGDGEYK